MRRYENACIFLVSSIYEDGIVYLLFHYYFKWHIECVLYKQSIRKKIEIWDLRMQKMGAICTSTKT